MALVRTTEPDDGVGRLTLDDPDRRNAITADMVDEIVAAVDRLEADPAVAALVVTGAPAGLLRRAPTSPTWGVPRREGLLHVYQAFLPLARSALPTVAAVNGPAVGAGHEPGPGLRRAPRGSVRPLRHPLPAARHPPRRRSHLDAAAPRRTPGGPGHGAVRRGARRGRGRRRRRSGVALRGRRRAARRGDGAGPAGGAVPPELAVRTKATMDDVLALDDHAAAVERELETQLWSMDTPEFAERLAALRRRITKEDR